MNQQRDNDGVNFGFVLGCDKTGRNDSSIKLLPPLTRLINRH